ncbi:MAG: hypothetical protein ACQESK_09440 [Bacteroidota bacterium]
MKFLKVTSLVLLMLSFSACSSDDDNNIDDDANNGNNIDSEFNIGSSERNYGNAYITYEDNQNGVDYYRLQIVPPGVTFDSSSEVFTGGSTGDYLSFDFKVPESEEFLVSGEYEVNFSPNPFTVEGFVAHNVTLNLGGASGVPMVILPEESEDIILEIDDNGFSLEIDAIAMQAVEGGEPGETNEVSIFGNYSANFEFIELE